MKFYLIILFTFNIYATENIKTKCVAHRGNNKYFLENSLEAINSAANLQSDGIEMDIWHTLDGHAIIMHDSTLERTAKSRDNKICPLTTQINQLTITEIRSNCVLNNGENIPLLIEALDQQMDKQLEWFIELKDIPSENTLEIIKNYIPVHQKANIISFKTKALKFSRHYFKKHKIEFDKIDLFKLYRVYFFNTTSFNPNVRYTSFNLKKLFKRNSSKLKRGVWTVDGSKKMEYAMKNEVDYLTTNDPELCLFIKNRMLKSRPIDNNFISI